MENVIIAALAAAWFIVLLDLWLGRRFYRIFVALFVSGIALVGLTKAEISWFDVVSAFAASFLALSAIEVMDRISRPNIDYKSRR